jgi:hypothetical protein
LNEFLQKHPHHINHNTEGVEKSLRIFGFKRMEHPLYSPNLAPCDFFLFSAIKQAFAGQYFETIDDLSMGVQAFLGGLSADFLQTVFEEWIRGLRLYREGGGEYVELTLQNGILTFVIARIGDVSPGQYRKPCISRPMSKLEQRAVIHFLTLK